MQTALESYFRVGEAGGKTADRFDELMKSLQEDQPGDKVEHRKVFEEDRDFNQGAPPPPSLPRCHTISRARGVA